MWLVLISKTEKDLSLFTITRQSLNLIGLWPLVYFSIIPFLASRVSEVLYLWRRRWLVWVIIFFALLGFVWSFKASARHELTGLVQTRLSLNRDGRIPLYVTAELSEDLYYYAEVPLYQISSQDLREKINSPEHFYAIVDGSILKSLKNDDVANYFVMKVEKAWALIEKPGL